MIVSNKDELEKFGARYKLFLSIFKEREALRFQDHQPAFQDPGMRLSDFMQAGLSSRRYCFAEAVSSFYGFDGLFRWSLACHIPHTTDSMMEIVARWIGRKKLGLQTKCSGNPKGNGVLSIVLPAVLESTFGRMFQ
jgi:hypothetical protein